MAKSAQKFISLSVISLAILASACAGVAQAHVGQAHVGIDPHPGMAADFASVFAAGFFHPLSGLDHLLVMLGVGFFASRQGRLSVFVLPLAFIAMMGAGAVLGFTGTNLPMVETVISLSVVTCCLVLILNVKPPIAVATSLVGVFALFHGQAHGSELPLNASALAYTAGFLPATALLLLIGITLGLVTRWSQHPVRAAR